MNNHYTKGIRAVHFLSLLSHQSGNQPSEASSIKHRTENTTNAPNIINKSNLIELSLIIHTGTEQFFHQKLQSIISGTHYKRWEQTLLKAVNHFTTCPSAGNPIQPKAMQESM